MLGNRGDNVIGKGYGENHYKDKQYQMERVMNTAGKYYPLSIKVIKNGWMVSDQWGRETAFLKKEDLMKFIDEWCG